MSIDGVNGRTSYIGTSILNIRAQLDNLTQQLASGRVSTTYAGQGANRGFALSLRAQVSGLDSYADTAKNVNIRLNVVNLGAAGLVRHRHVGEERGEYVDHRAQQQRSNLRPDHGAGGVLECGVAAQQPDRRPLSVFRTHHRHGRDRVGRRHARRRGNAGRVEATDQRAPPGRSGRQQHGASDGLLAAVDDHRDQPRRRRFLVRVEARFDQFVADGRDRNAAGRRAAGRYRRSRRRQSERRRQDHVQLQPARRHHRIDRADRDDQESAAGRIVSDRRRYGCDHRESAGGVDDLDPDAGRYIAGRRVRDRGIRQFLQSVRDRDGELRSTTSSRCRRRSPALRCSRALRQPIR